MNSYDQVKYNERESCDPPGPHVIVPNMARINWIRPFQPSQCSSLRQSSLVPILFDIENQSHLPSPLTEELKR